ncbi:MAG: IclR family transcriptional regulator [Clostridiales bacterium]|jgi:DNA-binding IclR family transcriptional regulator|nr:IclR family transcriptional regulator [Clostridiales bacterium]
MVINLESAKNLSAVKALRIIEYLASRDNEPQRLQDVANSLAMSNSTVFRFLQALAQSGYVSQQADTSRYFLTTKICSVANHVSANLHIYDLALPIMKRLAAEFDESVCLAVEQDMSVVYVGVVRGPQQILHATQYIGNHAPMHCTGVGKLLLLNYSAEELDGFVKRKGLPKLTQNTLTTKKALQKELRAVQKNGYALDNEECEIGARCIAVAARDYTGKIVAAVSVTGPTMRMTNDRLMGRLEVLNRAGRELSASLGYEPV